MKRQAEFYCQKCENKVHGFRCNYCGSLKVEARQPKEEAEKK